MAPYEGTRNYVVEDIVREMKGVSASAPANVANVLPIQPTAPEYKTIMSVDEPPEVQLSLSTENDYTASSSLTLSIDVNELGDIVIVDFPRPSVSSFLNPVPYSSHCFTLSATKLQ